MLGAIWLQILLKLTIFVVVKINVERTLSKPARIWELMGFSTGIYAQISPNRHQVPLLN